MYCWASWLQSQARDKLTSGGPASGNEVLLFSCNTCDFLAGSWGWASGGRVAGSIAPFKSIIGIPGHQSTRHPSRQYKSQGLLRICRDFHPGWCRIHQNCRVTITEQFIAACKAIRHPRPCDLGRCDVMPCGSHTDFCSCAGRTATDRGSAATATRPSR